MERFDRFTDGAQDAAQRCFEILERYGHTMVDVEHLLLALLEQQGGTVPEILEKLDVKPQAISRRLDENLQRKGRSQIYSSGVSQVYITPGLKRVIDRANQEAGRLKDEYVGAEHLFLAIPRERNTTATRVLAEAGVNRQRILDVLPEVRSQRRERCEKATPADPEYRSAGGVQIGTEAGAQPQLVLRQGRNLVRIRLRDVLPLIAALAQAAAELASDQREQKPL